MATPTSSATSASPPLAFPVNQPASIPSPDEISMDMDPTEAEGRKKAVQKFLARAEVSMVTRALRARLSYASYKARHNLAQVPLRDLETQSFSSQPHTLAGAKRKASSANSLYNSSSQGTPRRNVGAMAPPSSSAHSKYHANTISVGSPGAAPHHRTGGPSSNAAQSLFTSILAPPPTKQARTIHNPGAPVSAPARSTTAPKSKSVTRNKNGKDKKGKQKEKITPQSVLADMKAAETLTNLLMRTRTESATGTGSPRSSVSDAGGETASVHSFSHFMQSSARTAASGPSGTIVPIPSGDSTFRVATPPPSSQPDSVHTTPKVAEEAAPTDSEAADLMLYLATSPSPARPSTARDRDVKDVTAFGSGNLRAKGRVLFPGGDAGDGERTPGRLGGSPLKRGGEGSFNSISSIGSASGSDVGIGGGRTLASDQQDNAPSQDVMNTTSDSGTVVGSALTPSRLLPPLPSSPSAVKRSSNLNPSSSSHPQGPSPSNTRPSSSGNSSGKATPKVSLAPPTPSNLSFNFNDFINVPPSPAQSHMPPHRERSNLRTDVGRKLFEEDSGVGLGASIDLVPS